MAIRDWSGRKLARMWAWGLALELVLVGGSLTIGRANEPPEPPELRAFRLHRDSIDRGLLPPPREITAAERARLSAMLRDSLGITVETHGDTTHVRLPPKAEQGLSRAVDGLEAMILVAMIIAALIYLPIPLVLVGVTGVWLVARRRRPPPVAPPVASPDAPPHSTSGPLPR